MIPNPLRGTEQHSVSVDIGRSMLPRDQSCILYTFIKPISTASLVHASVRLHNACLQHRALLFILDLLVKLRVWTGLVTSLTHRLFQFLVSGSLS